MLDQSKLCQKKRKTFLRKALSNKTIAIERCIFKKVKIPLEKENVKN
jgi:hypothetical protein